MDSKIYVCIDYTKTWGDLISIGVAQAGNTVIYLSEDESQGFAAVAKEPRVRFRYCIPSSLESIAKEIKQTETYIASIDGIIVLVEPKDLKKSIQMKHWSKLGLNLSSRENEISVNYLVIAEKSEDKEELNELYLTLCNASLSQKKIKNIKANHIIIDKYKAEKENALRIVNTVSSLIVYLSTPHSQSLRFQIFYM